MRKLVIYFTAALLAVAVLGLAVAGCGGVQSSPKAGATTPEGIMNQAMTASTSFGNGTGQFDLSIAVNGDAATMPAETAAMLAQPITLTGTFSASEKPMALDISMTAALAGQNLPLGLKMTGGKAWIQFMGTWYEAPAELMTAMPAATTDSKTTNDSLLQVLKTAGIDVNTWITGLKIVGEDDLDGTKAYHLSGSIDMSKVVADALKMSQDKNLQSAIPGMDALGSTGTSLALPTGTDMAELQKQLGTMFQTFTVDIWVTKDDYQVRKAAINAKIVPPAGQDAQGIKDITLTMNFSMAPSDAPVTIIPPAGARPYSELETALGALSGMFGGMLGGSGETTMTTAP
jgi:hypothetical protein